MANRKPNAPRPLPTVKVKNPDIEGEYVVINRKDFREGVHELFEEAKAEKKAEKKPDIEPKKDDEPTMPEGYRYENGQGGYGILYGPAGQVIEGPASSGKFHGEAAAIEAAIAHAAG